MKEKMQRNAKHLPQLLYVEDDQISREVVTMFLKDEFEIELAADSSEAISKIQKTKFDAILMDINLCKGLGGLELAKEIRGLTSYETIPIIAVTAHAFKEDERKILKGGCSHYISKPFSRKSLLNVIHRALND
jgi:CheY-like chemotaxis protein